MKDEEIVELIKKYDKLLEYKKLMTKLNKEIEELEKNKYVIEYIEKRSQLHKILDIYLIDDDISKYSDEELFFKAIEDTKITNTKNIYVYVGTYKGKKGLNWKNRFENKNYEEYVEEDVDSFMISSDKSVDYDDPEANYRSYLNIELSHGDKGFERNIPIKRYKRFERNNAVLYPDDLNDGYNYYKKLKKLYFSTIIEENKDKVLTK